jgi:uncharacterized protein YidB (DUF937 family)
MRVLDLDGLAEEAAEDGVSVELYADRLAQELPAAADAVTPQGELTVGSEFEKRLYEFYNK